MNDKSFPTTHFGARLKRRYLSALTRLVHQAKNHRRRIVSAAIVVMLAGLMAAPLAFARIINNTIDPVAVVTDNGRMVIATGPISCTRGEQAFLRVTVTQRPTGAVAEGRSRVVCTGNIQQWQVHAATRRSSNLRRRTCSRGRHRSQRRSRRDHRRAPVVGQRRVGRGVSDSRVETGDRNRLVMKVGATMSNSDFSQPTQQAGALIRTIGLAITLVALGSAVNETAHSQTTINAMKPIPIPAQVPVKDGQAQIPDTKLWYWDTGGTGAPIVLLHPATGSALIWGYQQPVFAKAAYRVIAYSRRGYYNSAPFDPNNPGIGSEDLRHLADFLGLGRFHIVASAAGGSIASDFAFSYQDRLLSLSISSNSFAVRDGEIAKAAAFIRPKGFDQLPPEFREVGPSYRAANPEGVKAWLELEHKALIGPRSQQTLKNEIKQARLKELKLPTLLIAGSADLYTPPSISRMIAAEIPNSRVVLAPESGHSVYWEQPEIFNSAVLDFIGGGKK